MIWLAIAAVALLALNVFLTLCMIGTIQRFGTEVEKFYAQQVLQGQQVEENPTDRIFGRME